MIFSKLSTSNFPWKILTIESVVVVLSVLLALGVDSWRQSIADQELAEQALQGILDEVDANCSSILVHREYHEAVESGREAPRGIQVGLLRNDAWDVAKSIGATPHLPYGIAASVAAIDAQQNAHRTIVQAYIQSLFSLGLTLDEGEDLHTPGERFVIRELLGIQNRLLDAYAHLAELAQDGYPAAVPDDWRCEVDP